MSRLGTALCSLLKKELSLDPSPWICFISMLIKMNEKLSPYISTPFTIKNKPIANRLVLAPMAGLGHIALRQLISEFGGFGLLFTGMCSAKAVPHENPNVSPVFKWRTEELPYLVCQIFGAEPGIMAAAAERIEKEKFFGVDLNFGCSVAAICKKGCGAALLKNPDLAAGIVKEVRNAVNIPVFAKYRTGWDHDPQFAVDMARRFEDSGADALTFHPRVAPDRRNRPPRWEIIKLVQDAVSIPVFGNGNLFTESDGLKMIKQTGCQGLSIGRMAVARPWLFAQWSGQLAPGDDIYKNTAMRLIDILETHYDDFFTVKLFKKFAPYFCANFKFGHNILKKLVRADSADELRDNINNIFSVSVQTLERPNQHLFL